MTRLPIFIVAFTLLCAPIASAEDEVVEPKQEETPITKWVAAENALIQPLSKEEQETFFILRNKHSVIRTLRVVHDDIETAVKLCAKENETLSSGIKSRLKDWENAVFPILDEADKFLKQEIKTQTVVPSSDVRRILKLNDKAYKFSQSKIKKQPVSDEKSCNALMKSMDKTENELITLLQTVLLPEEVVRERIEQDKKASGSDS